MAYCSWFVSVFFVTLVTHSPRYGYAQLMPDHIRGVIDQQKPYHKMGYLEDVLSQRVQLVQNVEHVMDDVQTLKNEVYQLKTENINLKQAIRNMSGNHARKDERTPIAFYAYYSKHFKSLPKGETFIFDSVETNLGQGYNKTTGAFTAPTSGLYAFTWTLSAAGRHIAGSSGNQYGEMGSVLTQNGIKKGSISADTEKEYDDGTSTGFVVLNTIAGDEIKIVSPWNGQGSMYSDDHYGRTSFSGFQIN